MADGSVCVQGEIEGEIQFIDAAPKEFDCPICLETLKNPFTIECCYHHFCHACIDYAKQRKNECPLCKAQLLALVERCYLKTIRKAQCAFNSFYGPWPMAHGPVKFEVKLEFLD